MGNKNFLILTDTNFGNNCVEPKEYLLKLEKSLKNSYGDDIVMKTVEGKRGLSEVIEDIECFEVDDKNKTAFKDRVEDRISDFDYLILLTITEDPYLNNVYKLCSEYKKTIIKYKYIPRG